MFLAEAMGVPLKTKNEECPGNSAQTRRSEGGRRDVTVTSMQKLSWQIPLLPSARLTHGLKLDIVVWLLRYSVLRGTPMAFTRYHFKRLKCYVKGHSF
jgi:hypothetical protein